MRLKMSPKPDSPSARAMRAILAGPPLAPVGADPPVADARLGEDQRGRTGHVLKLPPQVRHVHPQVVALVRVAVPPHLLQQPPLCEELPGVANELLQQGELRRRG